LQFLKPTSPSSVRKFFPLCMVASRRAAGNGCLWRACEPPAELELDQAGCGEATLEEISAAARAANVQAFIHVRLHSLGFGSAIMTSSPHVRKFAVVLERLPKLCGCAELFSKGLKSIDRCLSLIKQTILISIDWPMTRLEPESEDQTNLRCSAGAYQLLLTKISAGPDSSGEERPSTGLACLAWVPPSHSNVNFRPKARILVENRHNFDDRARCGCNGVLPRTYLLRRWVKQPASSPFIPLRRLESLEL
jgi:hypothetical protein